MIQPSCPSKLLLAEHREITRIPNAVRRGRFSLGNLPTTFRLGAGHVRFFYDKLGYLGERYGRLLAECQRRGFNVTDSHRRFDGMTGDYQETPATGNRDREIESKGFKLLEKTCEPADFSVDFCLADDILHKYRKHLRNSPEGRVMASVDRKIAGLRLRMKIAAWMSVPPLAFTAFFIYFDQPNQMAPVGLACRVGYRSVAISLFLVCKLRFLNLEGSDGYGWTFNWRPIGLLRSQARVVRADSPEYGSSRSALHWCCWHWSRRILDGQSTARHAQAAVLRRPALHIGAGGHASKGAVDLPLRHRREQLAVSVRYKGQLIEAFERELRSASPESIKRSEVVVKRRIAAKIIKKMLNGERRVNYEILDRAALKIGWERSLRLAFESLGSWDYLFSDAVKSMKYTRESAEGLAS